MPLMSDFNLVFIHISLVMDMMPWRSNLVLLFQAWDWDLDKVRRSPMRLTYDMDGETDEGRRQLCQI